MQSSKSILHDRDVEHAMLLEYRCSYCLHILSDTELRVQPCPYCDEWHWIVEETP